VITESTDILDYWQFNLDDKVWEEFFPDPTIGLTGNTEDPERRHDVQMQFAKHGHDYHCLFTGDKAHDSDVHTLGCIFDVDTVNNGQCNNPKKNHKQGSWQIVNYSGVLQRAKYPATAMVGLKGYSFGGVHEEPLNATHNVQVFNTGVQVFDFRNFKHDHGTEAKRSAPVQNANRVPSGIPTSPFIDMELTRQKIVSMGQPDPRQVFHNRK